MAPNLAVDSTSCGYLRQVNTPFKPVISATLYLHRFANDFTKSS